MARDDWSVLSGSADGTGWGGSTILRDATFGVDPPNGGSPGVFGINSREPVDACVGIYTTLATFSPTPSGARIEGCIQRGVSGGPQGFSQFLFGNLSGSNVADVGYLLGIEDQTPGRIVLVKGSPNVGIPNDGLNTKVLRTSSETISQGKWIHLRMDLIVQGSGDVVIRCYQNDVEAHPLDIPSSWVWVPIVFDDGWSSQFEDGYFIDDVVGVNSGSVPIQAGFAGFASKLTEAARRSYFDNLQITKQV